VVSTASSVTAVSRSGPFLALLTGAAAIALAPIFVRVSETGPVASAFWRCALAVPVLWAWVFVALPASERKRASFPLPIVFAGLFFAGDLGVWHFSIMFTSVANSTLLANLAPIFVTVGGWLIFRQRVTRTFLIGMMVAMLGAFVLVGPSFTLGDRQVLGDALGVVTAMFYGAYLLAVKYSRDSSSTALVMAASTLVCALALAPVAFASGEIILPATSTGWLTLVGLALVCQTAGQSLIAYAMAHLPAAFSAVSLLLQPALAAIYAWLLLGEPISAIQFAGGAVILVGIYLARRGSAGGSP
jgi:drug/metabolite transporter (DMT)-like permease